MKTNLSYLIGIAALAVTSAGALAQSTTDPVGYITIPSGVTSPGVSFIGATLVKKTEYQAAVTVAGSGTTVTLPTSAGPFGLNSISQPKYYLEIASGPDAGKWTDIQGVAGTVFTLSDPIGGLITIGTSIKIREHHTFDSFFGSTESTVTVVPGLDGNSADIITLLAVGGAPISYFFSTDDGDVLGWKNVSTGFAAGDEVIAPGAGMKLQRPSGVTVKPAFVQSGHVKTGPTSIAVETGTNYVTIPLSTGWAVADDITFTGGTFTSTGLLGGLDGSSADTVEVFLGGAPTQYFVSTDDGDPGLKPGPFTAGEGTSVRIKRQAGAAFNMLFPAQVIAP